MPDVVCAKAEVREYKILSGRKMIKKIPIFTARLWNR
jgi:hypothetical protein